MFAEWLSAQSAALTNIIDGIGNAFVDKTMGVISAQTGGAAGAGATGGVVSAGQENIVRLKINQHLNAMEKVRDGTGRGPDTIHHTPHTTHEDVIYLSIRQ